jgi:diguanylate cyclase (GGDEF)-like protein
VHTSPGVLADVSPGLTATTDAAPSVVASTGRLEARPDNRPLLLAVDDEPVNLRVIVDALGTDYRVRTAGSGARALEIAGVEPPDLVLLDVKMPGMDGYEVCRRLKGDADMQDVPVVFVTTLDDEDHETRGLEAGAVDYIAKPIKSRALRARVRAHLTAKGKQDRYAALSRVDALTGIANRRRFDEALRVEWRRNLRGRTPLALVMCDIDHFKRINDTQGHLAGDRCLRRVANAIAEAMRRPSDLAARFGGEEFAAILSDTEREGARRVAEAICDGVARANRPDSDLAVTISCGVACVVPSAASTPASLLERADACLYRAKAAGRNRVEG